MSGPLSNSDVYKKEKIIHKNLIKYNQSQEKLSQYKIKNLIFHKKSHYTSIFIEYLIYDDNQEFLFELYPLNYCIPNMVSYIKIQHHKLFMPMVINEWGRNLIKINISMKKIFLYQMKNSSNKNDNTGYILKKKYSNILPSELSDFSLNEKEDMIDSFKTYRNFMNNNCTQLLNTHINNKRNMNNIKVNLNEKDNHNNDKTEDNNKNLPVKGIEISESESTIDNVNANNDISISLDLKINQIYDDKLLKENMEFVKGKNGKNDLELLKMVKCLKPISTANLYQSNKNIKNKIKSNNIYLDYVHNKKYISTKSSSKNKSEKKRNINMNKEHLKALINMNKFPLYSNLSSSRNKIRNILINGKNNNTNEKNLIKKNKVSSNSNNKVNSNSKNHLNKFGGIKINNITNNYNIINDYNNFNNKTKSPKSNNSNKNRSENHKPELKINRNKNCENAFIISMNNLILKSNAHKNNEQTNGQDKNKNKKCNQKEIKPTSIINDESKLGKIKDKKNTEDNSIQTITVPQKFISNSRDKKYETIRNNNINNVNIVDGGDIKVLKKNNNKLLDISDTKKIKLFTTSKDENNNINKDTSRKKGIKKEKSLDCKLSYNNINNIIKPNKKNITSAKRKVSDGKNNFH